MGGNLGFCRGLGPSVPSGTFSADTGLDFVSVADNVADLVSLLSSSVPYAARPACVAAVVLVVAAACASRSTEVRSVDPPVDADASRPAGGSAVPTEPGEAREWLTAEQLKQVIAAATPRVRKQCWQPALDARAPGAPTNVSVPTHIEIDSSGAVTEVQVQDAPPSYPGLSSCIAGVLRSVRFPRSAGTTSVNIPFVFQGQEP